MSASQLGFLLRSGAALAALAGLGGAAPAAAVETIVRPAVAVSPGPSPLRNCTADDVPGQEQALDAVNYPSTEIEPWLAINPVDRRNLIAGWQQDRWSDGGARALLSAYSADGGSSWTRVRLPRISKCDRGPWIRSTDPWVDFGPGGTAYFMTLAFENAPPTGGDGPNAMIVSRSLNGGRTWSGPITLIEDNDPRFFNDKNTLTADPTDARYAYAVWGRLENLELGGPGLPSQPSLRELSDRSNSVLNALRWPALAGNATTTLNDMAANVGRAARAGTSSVNLPPFFKGPAWFARTVNGGATWEEAREIYDPGVNQQTIGNQIAVLPDGDVLNFFTEIRLQEDFAYSSTLRYQRSVDKGRTFSPNINAQAISRVNTAANVLISGVFTPDGLFSVRDGALLFDLAVDPDSGAIYAVWQDKRFRSFTFEGFSLGDKVAFAQSTDGGRTWSRPILVSQTPLNANKFREQAFLPSVAVSGDGTIVVTYYDFRNDVPGLPELSDHWAVFCDPSGADCADAGSWGDEARLTNVSFDYFLAPVARGLFLGDYMGLAGSGRFVHALYGIADGLDRTSLFTRRIKIAPEASSIAAID